MVTSAKMQKTIVVEVTRRIQHSLYQRYVRVSKKFYAHDEQGEAKLGDTVRIVEIPPTVEIEALAAGGSGSTPHARGIVRREPGRGADAKLVDGGR